jgi:hypothetical protein
MNMHAIVGLIIRHVLSGAGGALLASGYVGASEWEAISGGALALVGVVMSYINKKRNGQ